MLNVNRIALTISLILLVLCSLGGCRASRVDDTIQEVEIGVGGSAEQLGFGTAIPAPSALLPLLEAPRQTSYAESDYIREGKDFLSTLLPHQHAMISNDNVKFTPAWSATSKASADLGFCFYRFDNISGFGRAPQLTYRWHAPPSEIGTAWLGVANWDRDRWDWFQCNEDGVADLPNASFLPYTIDTDHLLAVMVAANDETSALRYLRLGPNTVDAQLTVTPKQSLAPLDIDANGSASTTIVGTLDHFEWNWDGNDTFEHGTGPTATAQHTYNDVGEHPIQMRVINSYGESGIAAAMVGVAEPWVHSLGGSADEHIEAIAYDGADNIYAAGFTLSYGEGSSDVLLLKYAPTGELIWARAWGGPAGEIAYAMCLVGDEVYLAGYTYSFGEGANDLLLQRWDSEGNHLDSFTWGGTDYDKALSITSRGDAVYVAGTTLSYGAGKLDGVLIKYDLGGSMYWAKTWGGAEGDQFNAVTTSYIFMTQTTTIHLTGYTDSVSGTREVLNLRFAEDGSLSTQRTWAAGATQEGTCIATYGLFDEYIGGTIDDGGDSDLLLLCNSASPFAVRWDEFMNEEVTGVIRQDNRLVLTGWADHASGKAAMLASFSTTGEKLGAHIWQVDSNDDRSYSICSFANNGVLVGGKCVKAEGGIWWTMAMDPTGDAGGTWTDQAITLGSYPDTTSNPLGTVADITDAIIDTGGGMDDALVSLHQTPVPPY